MFEVPSKVSLVTVCKYFDNLDKATIQYFYELGLITLNKIMNLYIAICKIVLRTSDNHERNIDCYDTFAPFTPYIDIIEINEPNAKCVCLSLDKPVET